MKNKASGKLENTILYLLKRSAEHRPAMTVLLKMLWYVDLSHYRKHLASVTGAQYLAAKRGPVVEGYKALFDRMEKAGSLKHAKEANAKFPETPTQYYSAAAPADTSLFSESEIDAMEKVIAECAHQTGAALSDMTHGSREPWTLVWDASAKPAKRIPELVWRWSENLPDAADLDLARRDVRRPHVYAALEKIWETERAESATKR